LLYNNYTLFSSTFRKNIAMYLLGKVFFKLFLNWAPNIRIIFHNMLVYRIVLQSSLLRLVSNPEQVTTTTTNTHDDIRLRYKRLMSILKSAQELK